MLDSIESPSPSIEFPEALQCLFQPKRFKVLRGGRGAGRSWGVARALLLIGAQRSIRVLCVREFQNSIGESVHKVLSDQIEALGLNSIYRIEKAKIYGTNGTEFSFEGIKNNTTRIKSYEGIDYCWVEEAVKVSKSSWEILIPTIRREGSEIWMTFNPELETDYTYKRWVVSPDESTICRKMTFEDNPWFPEVLRQEMLRDKER
ncbi:MAG TPA: PBSX family phage terminase large subunit, partial [Nitrospira sp.]|nr:PBSX family phage terminase large subunit [Nitrospira sp.]